MTIISNTIKFCAKLITLFNRKKEGLYYLTQELLWFLRHIFL